jgi:DNA polymerase III subunit gamma/tau
MVSDTLAVRYRPRRLDEVVGQRHVTAVLRAALAADMLPRQILFSGGSGLGKTTLARCVAAALCCTDPSGGDACGVCGDCCDVAAGTHPDVVEFDAASRGTKDQIRELAARASTSPVRAAVRCYIVDELQGLSGGATSTQGAGTALLALLEDPPDHVVFLMATTDPDKVLRTIRGRCVEFMLRPPSADELAERLVEVAAGEHVTVGAVHAAAVVEASDPALGLRGALMNLERVVPLLAAGLSPDEAVILGLGLAPRALRVKLADALAGGRAADALSAAAEIRDRVGDQALLMLLRRYARTGVHRAARDAAALTGPVEALRSALSADADPASTDLLVAQFAALNRHATPDRRVTADQHAAGVTATSPSPIIPPAPATSAAAPACTARTPERGEHHGVAEAGGGTDVPDCGGQTPPGGAAHVRHHDVVAALRGHDRLAAAVLAGLAAEYPPGEIVVADGAAARRLAGRSESVSAATGLRVRVVRADAGTGADQQESRDV